MAKKVVQSLTLNAYLEFARMRPIQFQQLPRGMFLPKEDFPFRALRGSPVAHPPEKGAQMSGLQPAARTRQEMLKERLGLQLGSLAQHRADFVPNFSQRIGAGAPGVGS